MKVHHHTVHLPLLLLLLIQASTVVHVNALVDLTKDSLHSFFDEQVPDLLNRTHGVGMTVSAVLGDEIVFAKGYGYANLEKNIPVNAEETLFRPGSVSKMFVWTAVMHLIEQQKLDLNTNVNTYLAKSNGANIQIPDTYPGQPVTLKHLLTHTSGFDDYLFGLFTKDPTKVLTQEEVIRTRMPMRKRAPGLELEYSNYGAMLAAYIVKVVSGKESFDEYVKEHIFEPLNMTHSSFRQPLPDHLQPHMSIGYAYDGKNQVHAREFEIVQGSPAGGLSASAVDMAKFLREHLLATSTDARTADDDSRPPPRILQPSTIQQMHSTLFRAHPDINGVAHGLLEMDLNGQRVIGHGGDTIYFHSVAGIVPGHKLAFFFSLNTGTEGGVSMPVVKLYIDFMNHFFQDDAPTGRELALELEACTDTSRYAGNYLANRRSETEPFKLMALLWNLKVAKDSDNNGIRAFNIFTQQMEPYAEISPGVFQALDGYDRIAFLQDNSTGMVDGLVYSILPMMTFHRPPLWEQPMLNAAIVLASILLLLLGIFAPPIGLLTRFFHRNESKPSVSAAGQARAGWLGFAVVVLYIAFSISVYVGLDSDFIFAGKPPVWPFLVPWAAFAVGLTLPIYAVVAWKHGYWRLKSRIFFTIFAIDMQAFFWFLWYWKIAAS